MIFSIIMALTKGLTETSIIFLSFTRLSYSAS